MFFLFNNFLYFASMILLLSLAALFNLNTSLDTSVHQQVCLTAVSQSTATPESEDDKTSLYFLTSSDFNFSSYLLRRSILWNANPVKVTIIRRPEKKTAVKKTRAFYSCNVRSVGLDMKFKQRDRTLYKHIFWCIRGCVL